MIHLGLIMNRFEEEEEEGEKSDKSVHITKSLTVGSISRSHSLFIIDTELSQISPVPRYVPWLQNFAPFYSGLPKSLHLFGRTVI